MFGELVDSSIPSEWAPRKLVLPDNFCRRSGTRSRSGRVPILLPTLRRMFYRNPRSQSVSPTPARREAALRTLLVLPLCSAWMALMSC
eukprot:1810792-Pyramimonas_sp.AAC.1